MKAERLPRLQRPGLAQQGQHLQLHNPGIDARCALAAGGRNGQHSLCLSSTEEPLAGGRIPCCYGLQHVCLSGDQLCQEPLQGQCVPNLSLVGLQLKQASYHVDLEARQYLERSADCGVKISGSRLAGD